MTSQPSTPPSTPYILARTKVFCNYCPGFCCFRLPGATLYLDNDDINRIARHFKMKDGDVRNRFLENRNTFKVRDDGSCIFLKQGAMRARCTIHLARPRQCREFPYNDPCPYLEREDLLEVIQPLVEQSVQKNENNG